MTRSQKTSNPQAHVPHRVQGREPCFALVHGIPSPEVERSSLQGREVIFDVLHARRKMLKETEVLSSPPSTQENFLLPFTGFDIRANSDKWRRNMVDALENDSSQDELIKMSLGQTVEDVRAFWAEYLVHLPVLPIPIQFQEKGSTRQIVAPRYGNQLFVETVSEKERNGVVKEAVGKASQILQEAPAGSVVVTTSPPGWSGRQVADGREIIYLESQTYIYQVGENDRLEAITLVTDMSLEENERLMKSLSGYSPLDPKGASEQERIEDVVAQIAFLEADKESHYTFEDIVWEVQEVMQRTFARGKKTFSDIRQLIERRRKLLECDETTEVIIGRFQEFVRKNIHDLDEGSLRALEEALGKTILTISAAMRRAGGSEAISSTPQIPRMFSGNYQEELHFLQSLPGCNGGGQAVISAPLGVRIGLLSNGPEGGRRFVRNCGNCGKPINKSINAGYVCSSCGGVYEGC